MEPVPNEAPGISAAAPRESRPARGWARGAAPLLVATGIMLAASCSIGTTDQAVTTMEPAVATPSASAAPEAKEPAGITPVEYLALFTRVSAGTVESVSVLNGFALFINTNDEARGDLSTDVQLLIGSIELQLDVLEAAEPVPPDLTEAHEALKTALSRYIEAAALLLPPDQGGPDRFDFFRFQPLVEEAGENFHGAGAALP